jgi:hypothetical protein
MELGSTATSYEPFVGNQIPVSWSDAGTVYGGWVDAVKGVGSSQYGIVDISTIANGNFTLNTGLSGVDRWIATTLPSNCKNIGNSLTTPNLFADIYRAEAISTANSNRDTWIATILNGSILFYVPSGTYGSQTAFITAMTGHNLIYELATPQSFSLTPIQLKSLIGTNNIWSNANGNVDVRYWKH